MTDRRITTEEAERIANTYDHEMYVDPEFKTVSTYEVTDALRSLAAERDELRVALGEALDTSAECPIHPPCGNCKFCRAFKVYAAGSQP